MGAALAAITALAPIILQYGVPFAEQLFKMFSSTTGPTQADWDALKAATTVTARQQALAAFARAGIDPASPQAVALLALIPNP
jgi:hypothetical protein